MNICIIQARMSSSRLPGKVLLDIAGKPMLQHVVARVAQAHTVDQIVVATTTDPSDDPLAAFCAARGYAFTRGSMHDVLDRTVQAARQFQAEIVVRVTADCPLLDPGLLDETVELLIGATCDVRGAESDTLRSPDTEPGRQSQKPRLTSHIAHRTSHVAHRTSHILDFVANRLPPPWGRSYPIGLDVEVATMAALERAWAETSEKHHREHVMPYFYDDLPPERLPDRQLVLTPRGFRVAQLHHLDDLGDVRWTVDTSEDLEAIRQLVPLLPPDFSWLNALEIWQAHPEIAALNADIRHKTALDIDSRS